MENIKAVLSNSAVVNIKIYHPFKLKKLLCQKKVLLYSQKCIIIIYVMFVYPANKMPYAGGIWFQRFTGKVRPPQYSASGCWVAGRWHQELNCDLAGECLFINAAGRRLGDRDATALRLPVVGRFSVEI